MPASKSPRKFLILAKIEVTQFTDPVPAQGTNAILVKNLKVTPLKVNSEDRAIMRPYYGNSEQIPVLEECTIDFDVEIAGAGAAGTVPGYDVLLRACGLAAVNTPGVSTVYSPISTAQESITVYCYRDGLLYKFLGCRGTVKATFAAGKIPEYNFSFLGDYTPVTDVAMPSAPVYTLFQTPKASIPTWTGTTTLGGFAAQLAAVQLDLANVLTHAQWMNAESLDVMDRKPKGSITMQAVPIATQDPFTLIRNATLSAFTITHGTVAGNKVTIAAPKVQLIDLAETEFQNSLAYTSNLALMPNTGNDEITISVI